MLQLTDQYVDLTNRYLTDSQSRRLYSEHRHLPRSSESDCPTCGGSKEILTPAGTTEECLCHEQLQLAKHYYLANIGDTFQRLTWEDYESDPRALDIINQYLGNHEAFVRGGVGILYHGDFGLGKTMIASLAAKEFVRLGYDTFFTTFSGMIEMFTKGWGDPAEKQAFERKLIGSRVLFLDDIGREMKTKNNLAESTLDQVLRRRVIDSLPTFITTNCSVQELGSGYGGAIFSLIMEKSITHEMSGSDFRPTARGRAIQEIAKGIRRPIV